MASRASNSDDMLLPPGVTIERATPEDADTFVEIHEEAARWLWEQGIRQWQPGVFQKAWIADPIERGELYLATRGTEALGTVMLQWSDEYTWGKRPSDAGYIHGLRVRRSVAGQGLGRAMLRWAEREIARAGRSIARLDCIASNQRLCAYYLAAGYERTTDLQVEGEDRGALARFEKRLLPETVVILPSGTLAIRRAAPADADAIAAIHDDTMHWTFAQGFRRADPLNVDTLRADALERITAHEAWVAAREDGPPIATFALAWEDDGLWSDVPSPAVYLFAFAVKRVCAGKGVGSALLRWAARRVAAAGMPYLRLDCNADNPALRAYYEQAGFTFRGEAYRGSHALARYEKAVTMDTIETTRGAMTVALAGAHDVDAIVAIWDDAEAWMRSRGIVAEQPPRPMHDIVSDRVRRGEAYLGRVNGEPAATITLEWSDDGVWSDLPGEALYVHGLASKRAFAGTGLALLRWAERVAAEAGRSLLRLDCRAENPELRAYYERAGFIHLGDVRLAHRTAARFERSTATQ
jgi:ribosomal protein S18 acetylase RimI-like enzyme